MKFKSNKHPVSHILNLLMLVAMLSPGLTGCGESGSTDIRNSDSSNRNSDNATTVAALELSLNTEYPSRRFYTGRVEAARRSDLGFELGGLLKSVAVDEGDRVDKGDVLARLDTDRLGAQLKEAQAGVAQADAQLALASSTLNRLVEARGFDGVSQQQLDEASNAAATAEASLEAAASRLSRFQVDVAKARLLAPYNGVVLKRHYDEGQVLGPGQAVLSIQDTVNLQVRIGVAGSAANQLETGEYTLIINNRPVRAALRSVIPVRDAISRTVDAVFVIDMASIKATEKESAPRLQAGDLAQLELRRNVEAEGYWVPLTALAEGDRGLWNTYVVVRQQEGNSVSVVESRAVEVLYQDGSRAYVNGAVKEGDLIVPSGLNRIVPGQRVNLQKEGM